MPLSFRAGQAVNGSDLIPVEEERMQTGMAAPFTEHPEMDVFAQKRAQAGEGRRAERRTRKDIVEYWTQRAPSYSALNRNELSGDKGGDWLAAMLPYFPEKDRKDMRVLDLGCGPGFFSILLAGNGFFPDAADCTAQMLSEAASNAGALRDRISFHEMDASRLLFEDETFDVIVSRNLTWNLPNPCVCYEDWKRVLKPGGRIIIFDANWYHYLYDEKVRALYDRDRENVALAKIRDFNIGENFDVMERIAGTLPMTGKMRPAWDVAKLTELGYSAVDVDELIGDQVWTAEEKLNYMATPMFRIVAYK